MMRLRGLLPLLFGSALLMLGLGSAGDCLGSAGASAADSTGPGDIADLFRSGWVLEDVNHDEIIDRLDLRLLLPDRAGQAGTAAAANLAARFAFETSALDPGLVARFSAPGRPLAHPVIAIGTRDELRGLLPSDLLDRAGRLRPGQGVVLHLEPDETWLEGGAVVMGEDATGLLAAADWLAGRAPALWKTDGPELAAVREKLSEFLSSREIAAGSITVSGLVVDAAESGLSRLTVRLSVRAADDFARAVAAFEGREAGPQDTADVPQAGGTGGARSERERNLDLTALEFRDLHRLEVVIEGPRAPHTVQLRPRRPWETAPGRGAPRGASPDFTLSRFYSIEGLFRDADGDFLPDDTPAWIALDGTAPAAAVVDLATRIGLETTGLRLPLVRPAGEDDDPQRLGLPLLVGLDGYQLERLESESRLHLPTGAAGEGFLEFVPEAFGESNGLVLSGTDGAGLETIADYIARRLPWLWEYGRGNYALSDVENEVRRFFQAADGAGQTAVGIEKLETWLGRLEGADLERIEVELAVDGSPDGLDRFIENRICARYPETEVAVATFGTDYGVGRTIFDEALEVPWEVDTFRTRFAAEVLPAVGARSGGRITVLVSEPPAVRADLEAEIAAALQARGADPGAFEITVLCAYKQGFSWLNDSVLPRLHGEEIGGIEITYHTLQDSEEIRWQTIHANTRWLQEIFPIDAVMARELGIPDSLVTFRATQQSEPTYTVTVTDPAGHRILRDSFSARYIVRPFFDLFPEYESLRVTTGWVTADVDGRTVLDERIPTDLDGVWDHLQQVTYRQLVDYVMDLQEGRPAARNAPYFDRLDIEVALSEPDDRLGIDEEVISSLEALHEDIFFETLTLFSLLGSRYGVGGLNYPGRILPWMHALDGGGPGRMTVTLTGRERAFPELVLTTTAAGVEPERRDYTLTGTGVEPPVLRGIAVRAGDEELSRLLFDVTATDTLDRYAEYRWRGDEEAIDAEFLDAGRLLRLIGILRDLHGAGLYEDELGFDRVGELVFRVTLEDSIRYSRTAVLPRPRHPRDTHRADLRDRRFSWTGERIVPWETPIPPGECAELLARLNTFPEVNVSWAATSTLGHDLYSVELYPPVGGSLVSRAKLNASKPTLFCFGRVHGNEVSSTSHILRLIELCATDSTWRAYLDRVNVVLYPITNPDGAQIAYDMWQDNPDFMLHVGRPGAFGTDVSSRVRPGEDPVYPESGVVYELRELALPDIVIDMHGVPSHEWVQHFAGYSAWVRSRYGGARSYWLPRGWYIPGFSWIEDERYPEIETAQQAITDSIVIAVTSVPEVEEMNRRIYGRYIKYGRQDAETYREYFYRGIQLEARLGTNRVSGSGLTGPKVTYYSITTEAADETAYGQWLELVCRAGLAHSTALLRYLADGDPRREREAAESAAYITRTISRTKPVLPRAAEPPE